MTPLELMRVGPVILVIVIDRPRCAAIWRSMRWNKRSTIVRATPMPT